MKCENGVNPEKTKTSIHNTQEMINGTAFTENLYFRGYVTGTSKLWSEDVT